MVNIDIPKHVQEPLILSCVLSLEGLQTEIQILLDFNCSIRISRFPRGSVLIFACSSNQSLSSIANLEPNRFISNGAEDEIRLVSQMDRSSRGTHNSVELYFGRVEPATRVTSAG